jgi:hypothetical protein
LRKTVARLAQVYQLVWQSGEAGMELPDLKAALDRTMHLERTIKTQKLRGALFPLTASFSKKDPLYSWEMVTSPKKL